MMSHNTEATVSIVLLQIIGRMLIFGTCLIATFGTVSGGVGCSQSKEGEVAQLRAEVERLRTQVDASRGNPAPSMTTKPIAVDDVLAYLLAAKDLPAGESRIFEIGGNDVVTYSDLIRVYSRLKHLRRWLIVVPVLTPYLSGLWLALVTPASFEVGRHLIEGLKNPTIVRDDTALKVFNVRPMGVREAIEKAMRSDSP